MRSIIVYFSRAGENYVNGEIKDLKVGNTEIAVKMLQKATGSDVFRIEPLIKYPANYTKCIEQAQSDQRRDARPELEAYPEGLDSYDVIFLAYPNYWGTMPMPVFTFLERYDLSGKTICPLCTHEGSGMGHSEADMKKLCPGALVKKGLPIHGAEVAQAEDAIRKWAAQVH